MNDKELVKYMNQMPADMIAESSAFAADNAGAPAADNVGVPVAGSPSGAGTNGRTRAGGQPPFRFGRVFGIAAGVLLFAAGVGAALLISARLRQHKLPPNEEQGSGTLTGETLAPAPTGTAADALIPTPTTAPTEVPLTPTAAPTEVPLTPTAAPTEVPLTPTAAPTEVSLTPTAAPTALPATSTATAAPASTPAATPVPTPTSTVTPAPTRTPTATPTPTAAPTAAPTPTRTPTAAPTPSGGNADTLVDINLAMMTNQYKTVVCHLSRNTDPQGLKTKLKRFAARVKAEAERDPDSVETALLYKVYRLEDTDYELDYWMVGSNNALGDVAHTYQNNLNYIKLFLLEVDGEMYTVNGDCTLKITDLCRCDYDANGVEDLVFLAQNEDASRFYVGVFDRTTHSFRFMTEIPYNGYEAMLGSIGNSVYLANHSTRTAGRFGYDGSSLTFGGLAPDVFVQKVFVEGYDGAPELTDMPEPSATIAPYMDPERAEYMLSRYNFVTAEQTDKPWNYTHLAKAVYEYNGSGMVLDEYVAGKTDSEYTDWLWSFISDYASGESTYAISVSHDFSIALIEGGELLSLDIYDIKGDLVRSGLTLDGLYALAQSGGLPFTTDPGSGKIYPCFAVFEVKKYAKYFDDAGEREYGVMYSAIPFEP